MITGLPVVASVIEMAATIADIPVPKSSTVGTTGLPDTVPGWLRRPCVECLRAAARILREVERDEQRVREWPGEGGLGSRVDSTRAHEGHGSDSK